MPEEYDAKVFRSGNSVALRLPKAFGLREGDVMRLRREPGRLVADLPPAGETIDLSGIIGTVPGLGRPPLDDDWRDWAAPRRDG